MPGSAAGWQCAIEDHDSLIISTVGVPIGTEWKVELQDERWDRPFFTKCSDPNTVLRLGRGTKYAPAPTEPVRVRMRLGLVGRGGGFEFRHGSSHGRLTGVATTAAWDGGCWTEWVTLQQGGAATQFIPLGLEDLRPAFDHFNKGRAPAGHASYKELQAMLRSIGVDPTTKAASSALAAHQIDEKNGSATMAAGEFAAMVTTLRRVQLEEHSLLRKELEERSKRAEKEELDEAVRWNKVAPEIRAAFQRFDRDRSGKLDMRELHAALQHIGLRPSMHEAQELLRSYDTDRSAPCGTCGAMPPSGALPVPQLGSLAS